MNATNGHDPRYVMVKSSMGRDLVFLDFTNEDAVQAFRDTTDNCDLLMSCYDLEAPEPSAPRRYWLRFHNVSENIDTARVAALTVAYHVCEQFCVPHECMEILYNGGGEEGSEGRTHPAEIAVVVPPSVFDGNPTPLMPAMNYHLARQMAEDGIDNLDIDVYQRDHLIPLPNSINTVTGKFATLLTIKELQYLDGNGIRELSKKPKPEDSEAVTHTIPQAAQWFAKTLAEFEKEQHRQDDLRKSVLDKGWEVLPCIRQLVRLCLYDHNRLEAYRVISQFFAWIKAGPTEIRHLIHAVDQRNPLRDCQKIKAIITFAVENPWFAGCQHPLLRQFCPAGGCFMAKLTEKCARPCLFEDP